MPETLRLEEALGPLEEGLGTGWREVLDFLEGGPTTSSKSNFLLAGDAGIVLIGLVERRTNNCSEGERGGGGGVSSPVSSGVGMHTGSASTPFPEAIR